MASAAALKQLGIVLEKFHIRPVKNISFTFNPFIENVTSIRQSLFHLNGPKIKSSNLKADFKINIKSNVCEPEMKVNFVDGTCVLYKTKNLNTLEIFTHFSSLCNEKDTKEDVPVLLTKSEKKKQK